MTDDTTGLDPEGDPSTPEEKTVPYERFKEVNSKMRELETEVRSLKEKKSESGITPEQEKELQAKQYLKNLWKEVTEEEKRLTTEQEAKELQTFNQEVKDLLEVNTDVKKDEFLVFLEKEGDDYASVAAAMKGYKRIQETEKTSAERTKRDLKSKPLMPSSEGTGGGTPDYSETDKGKTLWQIAQDALKERGK